jgi:hypothetical protein
MFIIHLLRRRYVLFSHYNSHYALPKKSVLSREFQKACVQDGAFSALGRMRDQMNKLCEQDAMAVDFDW